MSCTDPYGYYCYIHPGNAPVSGTIYLFGCPSNKVCGLVDGEYAWVRASLNSLTNSANMPDSPLFNNYVSKQCENIENFA